MTYQNDLRMWPTLFGVKKAVTATLVALSTVGILVVVPAVAQEQSPAVDIAPVNAKVRERLQELIKNSGFKASQIGAWVGDKADAGQQVLFSQNSEVQYIPASLSKLVTAGAILQELHPGYKFKTQLVSDAAVKDGGVLSGDVYLKGGGDPSFVSENMWFLVNEFTRAGIANIEGDVVVDDSRFDSIRIGQDRESVRVDRAYDAPIGAMSMNWNSVNVYIRPGAKAGDPARVILDPDTPYLRLINDAKTTSPKSSASAGRSLAVERVSQKDFEGDVIRVTGKIALGSGEAVFYKSISHPDLWSGHNLVSFLKQRGITVRGKVRRGRASTSASALATYESKPLALIVADMSKFSNNYVGEMLVKNLAAENGVLPATMPAGMAQLEKFLTKVGFKSGEYAFVNASGFSRANKMTPAQLGRLLEAMREDFTSYPEFLTSLPIGGVDGTLKNRMKNGGAERWVRAKTGLLNGVVGLAGYAGRGNGHVRTFAFIYNGPGREDRARVLFDQMAAVLAED